MYNSHGLSPKVSEAICDGVCIGYDQPGFTKHINYFGVEPKLWVFTWIGCLMVILVYKYGTCASTCIGERR